MPDPFRILLDQNVSRLLLPWLRGLRPSWKVEHTSEVGLDGKSDRDVFGWAQKAAAVIVTFVEDFADQRSFPVGTHAGVIRLHVWPTTEEETRSALDRLFSEVSEDELRGALIIVERARIRVRAARKPGP